MRKRIYALISTVLISTMIPFASFAEEADGLVNEEAVEEESEEEVAYSLADFGISEDEYLVTSSDFYEMVKSIHPWSIIEDTAFSPLTERQTMRICEAVYPILKDAVGTDCVIYTWDEPDVYPEGEAIFDNAVYNPIGIKSVGHPDCKNANNNLVPILSYSDLDMSFTGESLMYPGRPSVFPVLYDESAIAQTLSQLESPTIIPLPEWEFGMKDAEDTFIKCPKFIIDEYWYNLSVDIKNVMTNEIVDADNPLYLDFGQYAVLKLTQSIYTAEPVSTYVIVVNGTPYTAEYTLIGDKNGLGSTIILPSDANRVKAEAPHAEITPAWEMPKPVDPTTTPEYIAMMEKRHKITVAIVSAVSGLTLIGLTLAFILTGMLNKVRGFMMLSKYKDTKTLFHGILTTEKSWSVKVTPYRITKKTPIPDTVDDLFRHNSCTEAISEIFDSPYYTFLPVSTEMVVYSLSKIEYKKELYRSTANEDELYSFLEALSADKLKTGVDKVKVKLINEKMDVDIGFVVDL